MSISAFSLSEDSLDGRHCVISIALSVENRVIHTHALIDCGASGYAFIDSSFARNNSLPFTPLVRPRILEVVDGRPAAAGKLTHLIKSRMRINRHSEQGSFLVTQLGHYPVVLGVKWLQIHDPSVSWTENTLTFSSTYCFQECLENKHVPLVISGLPDPSEGTPESASSLSLKTVESRKNEVSCMKTPETLKVSENKVSRSTPRTLEVSVLNAPSSPESRTLLEPPISNARPMTVCTESPDPSPMSIYMVGAAPFSTLMKDRKNEIFTASMYEIDKALEQLRNPREKVNLSASSLEDIAKSLKPKKIIDPASIVPVEFHDLLDVFSKQEADKLPPHRSYDHKIVLKEGAIPSSGPLYKMSAPELLVLQKYLKENLAKGFIRASSSPCSSPVLFARKPSGGLRFCVDYRALNAITIKNRYPIPLIQETLDRLAKAMIFSKFDIIAAFNKLRMQSGQEWMTAFKTRYGLFEYEVLPFGLSGGPGSFQHYINDVLREYLDAFCTAYIDDILVYSKSKKEHKIHVRKVLEALRSAGLQLDIEKCEFFVTETTYLGLIISDKGIKMDPRKVQTIKDWITPKNIKDIQAFVGFANFYRRFVKGFSAIASPLIKLTKKGTVFSWNSECEAAFQRLKNAFVSDLILMHFDPEKKIVVEVDASDWVVGGVLSQYDDEGVLRPVAFFSKKHAPAEINYEIYDKELMAIIRAFEEWRSELEGAAFPIQVISDHKNLEYFMTTKQLSRRQARWSEYLSRFDFQIMYRPGKSGGKPDALTRRSQDLPKGEDDPRIKIQHQVVLKPRNLELLANGLADEPLEENVEASEQSEPLEIASDQDEIKTLEELWQEALEKDLFPMRILELLRSGARHSKEISLAECTEMDGRLHYRGKIYVPDSHALKMRLCKSVHDSPVAGHPGRAKTFDLLQRHYYWPRFYQFVARYVQHCQVCARSKPSRQGKMGVLKPLPVPERRWQDISMDFVTGLPESSGFDAILVVVDRLSKRRHFSPCLTTINAQELAELFLRDIWKLHGLPSTVVSDRGVLFVSEFWKKLCQLLGIKSLLSTAFHPETDGQTERVNASMEQYLRSYTDYLQDDWASWLPMAEFTGNNVVSETTGCSPFLAEMGFHPRMGFKSIEPSRSPASLNAGEFAKKMQDISSVLQEEMKFAQARYETGANEHRVPAPSYQAGDEVWLSTKNIRTQRPARKLDWKNLGPFKISKVVSKYAYQLELPPGMKIHPVFHVSLLSPVPQHPHPDHIPPPAPPIEVEGEEEYEVEEILDSKKFRNRLKYLVQWTGWNDPTWEYAEYVTNAKERVAEFHQRYPAKPR